MLFLRHQGLVLSSLIAMVIPFSGIFSPDAATASEVPTVATDFQKSVADSQTLNVSASTVSQVVSRDQITVTEPPPATVTGKPVVSGWAGTVDTSNIVSIARSFIGQVPYVSGGASPEAGFDCSGFTQYVYGLTGVSLPHSSTLQGAMGTPIPFSEAQAGDLLIWEGHVAIYTGGNMMVDAQVPGTMIAEHAIWGSPTVVRI